MIDPEIGGKEEPVDYDIIILSKPPDAAKFCAATLTSWNLHPQYGPTMFFQFA